MFDIAWSELLLVAVIAILVVGPKELPGLLRSLGSGLGKLRKTADEFRKHFDDAVRDAGGEDLQREFRELKKHNPINQVRNSIEDAARDPLNTSSKKAENTVSDEEKYEDLGPPPPPLPPKNAPAPEDKPATATTGPAASTPASSASTEQGAPATPDTSGESGVPRINGEHRAAS